MATGRATRRSVRVSGCVSIAVLLAALAAAGTSAGALGGFQDRASDSIFPRGELTSDVVVVGVDARSLASTRTAWPWPRSMSAQLVRAIAQGEPKVTVLDVLFAPAAPGDPELARAIRNAGNVVLAQAASIHTQDRGVLVASTVAAPTASMAGSAYALGDTAITPDPNDGVVRTAPLVVEVDQALVPSLALAAIAAVDGADPNVIVRPHGVQVGHRTIPSDGLHRLRISWPGGLGDISAPGYISASDVLEGRVAPDTFKDKVVFVGITDPTLGDNHPTPLAKATGQPGVFVHAAAYNTIATQSYLDASGTTEVATRAFIVALLIALAVQLLPLWGALLALVAVPVASIDLGYRQADHGTVPNLVFPLIAVAIAVPASGALRYATETRRRREIARLFAQFVPESVAEKLMEAGRVEAATAGQRLDATVLFCDLRGFTAMSATLDPEEVNERLTPYYEYASRIVLDHGGTLMAYIGDEVFAIFGAPISDLDHAARGIACAAELQRNVAVLDEQLAAIGAPPLRFGIGLNSGDLVAAHTGSTWRRQYTVIGNTVNVGARLCSQADPGDVVLAEAVRARVDPPPDAEPMGPLVMKGVSDDFVAWRLTIDSRPTSP